MAADKRALGRHGGPPAILFSCTTFLALEGKLAQTVEALDSFSRAHQGAQMEKIGRFLLVNEYDEADTRAHAQELTQRFPWLEFVQKGPAQRGQAHSLNLILEAVADADVWIHWEESWACRRPFVDDALAVLASSDVTQLQVATDRWRDTHSLRPFQVEGGGPAFDVVLPRPEFSALEPTFDLEVLDRVWGSELPTESIWPLYSLRPSVNRAAAHRHLGRFDTRREIWPYRFEWDYGMRWFRSGAQKGIFAEDAAERIPGHVSTVDALAGRA